MIEDRGIAGQGNAGGKSIPPKAGRGEAETSRRVVGGFEFQDEQEAIDGDEPFVPEAFWQGPPGLLLGEQGLVLGVVNEFLDELADGMAGLFAKVFGGRACCRRALSISSGRALTPAGEASAMSNRTESGRSRLRFQSGQAEDNLGINAGRVGNEEAQFKAVGEEAEAFAAASSTRWAMRGG